MTHLSIVSSFQQMPQPNNHDQVLTNKLHDDMFAQENAFESISDKIASPQRGRSLVATHAHAPGERQFCLGIDSYACFFSKVDI